MEEATRQRVDRALLAVVGASVVLQVAALGALSAGHPLDAGTVGRHLFSTVEMALVAVVLLQAVRVAAALEGAGEPTRRVARRVRAGVALCVVGDLVNRNYPGWSFQFDDVIEHSYLIVSIVAFLPGYALVLAAARAATSGRVPTRFVAGSTAVALAVGVASFLDSYDPDVATGSSALMLAYTVVLAVLAASAAWVLRAYGAAGRPAALGLVLAPVADALIARYWIFGDGYPWIEHVNWIVYVTSLALIVRLPLVVADRRDDTEGR